MSKIRFYLPPNQQNWQGRADSPPATCFFQTVQPFDLENPPRNIKSGAFALIGFQCDAGIQRNLGRSGAKEGPMALRSALANLPSTPDLCFDAGDIVCEDQQLEDAQSALAECIQKIMQEKLTPIVLGGGHELAWGHYQGIAKSHHREPLGIVNFDAHFDMRPLIQNTEGSSGTPFLQIALYREKKQRGFNYYCIGIQTSSNLAPLYDTAKKYHTAVLSAEDIHQGSSEACMQFIQHIIDNHASLYVSICLDVFASAYAPGVSSPQSLGLTPWQVIPLLRKLIQSGKVLSYDIAELSPTYDIDNHTAKLGANLIHEILLHHKRAFTA